MQNITSELRAEHLPEVYAWYIDTEIGQDSKFRRHSTVNGKHITCLRLAE